MSDSGIHVITDSGEPYTVTMKSCDICFEDRMPVLVVDGVAGTAMCTSCASIIYSKLMESDCE